MAIPPRPSTPRYGPPTNLPPALQAIESARHRTLNLYARPTLNKAFQTWYMNPPLHPSIRARTKDLHNDRTQTNRQQVSLTSAKSALVRRINAISILPNTVRRETTETTLLDVYNRVLSVYDARLGYIHDAGQYRFDIWGRLIEARSQQEQEACSSTLEWMEQDYMRRKVDFVREVYSALENGDEERAMSLLVELAGAYPQLCAKTEDGVTTLRL